MGDYHIKNLNYTFQMLLQVAFGTAANLPTLACQELAYKLKLNIC